MTSRTRAGGSLAQGAGCDDLACVRDRLRAATISARDRCAASQNTATSRCRKLDKGAICYVGLSAALRRRLASKLIGLVAPISTIDGSNVVVHLTKPAIAVVFDEAATSASLKDAVQTFARSYDLDAMRRTPSRKKQRSIDRHARVVAARDAGQPASGTSDARTPLATKTTRVRRRLEPNVRESS